MFVVTFAIALVWQCVVFANMTNKVSPRVSTSIFYHQMASVGNWSETQTACKSPLKLDRMRKYWIAWICLTTGNPGKKYVVLKSQISFLLPQRASLKRASQAASYLVHSVQKFKMQSIMNPWHIASRSFSFFMKKLEYSIKLLLSKSFLLKKIVDNFRFFAKKCVKNIILK